MGAHPERVSIRPGIMLWEKGVIACASLTVSPDHIEITLSCEGTVVDMAVFTDASTAAAYAIGKMHAYNAG